MLHVRGKKSVPVNNRGNVIGENHKWAKLSDADVGAVFDLLDAGLGYAAIARKFDVSKSCIQKIATGRTRCQTPAGWREVSADDEDLD